MPELIAAIERLIEKITLLYECLHQMHVRDSETYEERARRDWH